MRYRSQVYTYYILKIERNVDWIDENFKKKKFI